MVDWDGLENRCAREGTVGSNPTLSSTGPSEAARHSPDNLAIPRNKALLMSRAVASDTLSSRRLWGRIGGTGIADRGYHGAYRHSGESGKAR